MEKINFENVETGDIFKIKNELYEVIGQQKEFECLPPEYNLKEGLYFDLLKKGSKKITPTGALTYLYDTQEISFSPESGKKIILNESEIKIIHFKN